MEEAHYATLALLLSLCPLNGDFEVFLLSVYKWVLCRVLRYYFVLINIIKSRRLSTSFPTIPAGASLAFLSVCSVSVGIFTLINTDLLIPRGIFLNSRGLHHLSRCFLYWLQSCCFTFIIFCQRVSYLINSII